MKNKIIGMVLAVVFLLTIFSSIQVTSSNNIETIKSGSTIDKKKWTFMMYEDEDFSNNFIFPILGLDLARASHAHSGKNLNVIILRDTYFGPGKYYYINEFGGRRLLKNLGEIDMGSYETLKNFIEYCKENFPAEHYILDFCDHGGGWMGTCIDEHINETDKTSIGWLYIKEIKKALTETGGLDIVSFITPCQMAAVESVYELRDCTKVYIGKQPNAHSSLQIIGPLCDLLNKEYYLSNIEIGKKIIDFYKDKNDVFPYSLVTGKTLSAMRTDEVTGLVNAINNLSKILTNNINEYIEDIRSVITKTEAFPTKRPEAPEWYKARGGPELVNIDIYDFVNNYLKIDGINETLRKNIQEVMEGVNKTVIAENHTIDHPDAHGLSIYFPDTINSEYTDIGLDFTTNTSWGEFIIKYHSFYATVDDDGDTGYTSIQNAIDNSSDGYVIYIKNGLYHENIITNKSITFYGESCKDTIIEGDQNGDVFAINADGVRLFFLNIRNSSDDGEGVFNCGNSTIIKKCNISDNNIGIKMVNSSNSEILSSNIWNNYLGINLIRSNNNKFTNNIFEENKINVRFLDSFYNNWKNKFLDSPNKIINLILGFRTITILNKFSFISPWFNLNWAY